MDEDFVIEAGKLADAVALVLEENPPHLSARFQALADALAKFRSLESDVLEKLGRGVAF